LAYRYAPFSAPTGDLKRTSLPSGIPATKRSIRVLSPTLWKSVDRRYSRTRQKLRDFVRNIDKLRHLPCVLRVAALRRCFGPGSTISDAAGGVSNVARQPHTTHFHRHQKGDPDLEKGSGLLEAQLAHLPLRSHDAGPTGESQIVPRSATVRSKVPAACRVTTDPLPRRSTLISLSGCVLFRSKTPSL
jgi:hypothetical protein